MRARDALPLAAALLAAGCVGAETSAASAGSGPVIDVPPGPTGPAPRHVESDAAARAAPFALLELFTSEGCSSCPPADALLVDLAREAAQGGRRIIPLSFHVDYWDRLGWADPFGSPAHTARQRAWAARHGGGVYTPQLVVGGREGFVGSDRSRVHRAVGASLDEPPVASVTLTADWDPASTAVQLSWAASGARPRDTVNLALTELERTSNVRRGENRGRQLTHAQVVRSLVAAPVGEGRGSARLTLPGDLGGAPVFAVAWVEDASTSAALGAATVNLGPPHRSAPSNPNGE